MWSEASSVVCLGACPVHVERIITGKTMFMNAIESQVAADVEEMLLYIY